MTAIWTEALRKEFPGGVVAVDGIDLEIGEGEMFGFLGPNGAGKTTTIRILTTLLRPTSGQAKVAGLDLAREPHEIRRRIGVALQEAGLDAISTGRELLILQARLYGFRGEEPAERAAALLDLVGLTEAADRRVKTYSGGMKRRLDLASALVHRPQIMFLDEPTSGLDPASREAIWEEIRRLNRDEGITVFLTTQYMEEADRLVDHLAIIDQGRIVTEGTPAVLKRSIGADVVTIEVPAERAAKASKALEGLEGLKEIQVEGDGITLFVSDGSGSVARVIRRLDEAQVPIGAVAVSPPTLDEVFLRATGSRLEGAAEGDGDRPDEKSMVK